MSDQEKPGKANPPKQKSDAGSSGTNVGSAEGPASGSRRNSQTEKIQNFMSEVLTKLHIVSTPKPKILEESTLKGVVSYMKSDKCKNIIVMSGAGISTSAGIPDFRSPNCGLYDSIQKKYKMPDPQVMFEIGYFRQNPEPFYSLAKELFPNELKPTMSHHFVNLLHKKGYLLRHYTQNIDGLDRIAGVPGGKIVEAHGTFHTSHCLKSSCHKEYPFEWMKEQIMSETLPKCAECQTLVKPDVVFFGESLPPRFFSCTMTDFPKCDLLIIMGTSLVVQPFAYLVNQVPPETPRVLINREIVGTAEQYKFLDLLQKFDTHSDFNSGVGSLFSKGLNFNSETNRDVAILGDCDDGAMIMAEALGWKDDLLKINSDSTKASPGQDATHQ